MAREVSNAADVLVSDRRYAHLVTHQRGRRGSNKYSIISSILTRAGGKKLMSICDRIIPIADARIVCYMYDGCVVRFQSEDARQEVQQSLRDVSTDIGIEVLSKSWRSPKFDRLSHPMAFLFSGDATFAPESELVRKQERVSRACLFNAV